MLAVPRHPDGSNRDQGGRSQHGAYLLLLISGILLMLAVGWPLGQAWLLGGIGLYVGAVALSIGVLTPAIRQLSLATGTGNSGYASVTRHSWLAAWAVVAMVAAATWLMMAKPTL
jgi:uncharacterized membrane protein